MCKNQNHMNHNHIIITNRTSSRKFMFEKMTTREWSASSTPSVTPAPGLLSLADSINNDTVSVSLLFLFLTKYCKNLTTTVAQGLAFWALDAQVLCWILDRNLEDKLIYIGSRLSLQGDGIIFFRATMSKSNATRASCCRDAIISMY